MKKLKKVPRLTWKMVEEFYEKYFRVNPELLELLYSFPILESYAKGIGVYSIMELSELDKGEIIKILEKYFDTWVFVEDLTFSPIDIFDVVSGNKSHFMGMIEQYLKDENNVELNDYLYGVCVKFVHLRERIKEYELKN